MEGKDIRNVVWPQNFILAIGNEANGLSGEIQRIALEKISIPVSRSIESLNASVACGIILFFCKK